MGVVTVLASVALASQSDAARDFMTQKRHDADAMADCDDRHQRIDNYKAFEAGTEFFERTKFDRWDELFRTMHTLNCPKTPFVEFMKTLLAKEKAEHENVYSKRVNKIYRHHLVGRPAVLPNGRSNYFTKFDDYVKVLTSKTET